MNKKFIWIIVGIVVVLVFVFGFYRQQSVNKDSIKIGMALALTGDAAPWGEVSRNAAQLAVDEINKNGGINGKRIEIVIEDSKSSSKDSTLAVSKLVNVDKVKAVMITWLDSYPGAESVIPKNMLLISQDAAIESVNVPVNHPNVFSLWYRTSAKAEVTLSEMTRTGIKTLYVVTQNDPYYRKLVEFLKNEALEQGISIIAEESLSPKSDVRTVVAKIGAAKPDAVFFGSYDDQISVSFIKSFHEIIGGKTPLYGDEFIEQDFTSKNFSTTWLEGMKYYVPAEPNTQFGEKYKARFGIEPKFSAGTTYDTVMVMAKFLTDAPSDLTKYMRDTEFDTVTYGKIAFDEIGGVVADKTAITMKQIVGQKVVPVK